MFDILLHHFSKCEYFSVSGYLLLGLLASANSLLTNYYE